MKASFYTRIISGLVFIPLLVLSILLESILPFMVILTGIVILGLLEFYDLIERLGCRVPRYIGLSLGMLFIIITGLGLLPFNDPYILGFDLLLIGSGFFLSITRILSPLVMSVVGAICVGWSLSHLGWLRILPDGERYLVACLLITWICDTFACIFGGMIGRHPLIPKISPKKTIEGAIAGLLGSVLASIIIRPILLSSLSYFQSIVIGILIGISSQFGDAWESFMKRKGGVKDSGDLIPGHGGLLDVFDGLILSGPVVFFCLILSGIARGG